MKNKILFLSLIIFLLFGCSSNKNNNSLIENQTSIENKTDETTTTESVSEENNQENDLLDQVSAEINKTISDNYGDDNGSATIDYEEKTIQRKLWRKGVGDYLQFYLDDEFDSGHTKQFLSQWQELIDFLVDASKEAQNVMIEKGIEDPHFEILYMDDRIYNENDGSIQNGTNSDNTTDSSNEDKEEIVFIKLRDGEVLFDIVKLKQEE